MGYTLSIANKPKKFIEKLFPDYKGTVKERLIELQTNPYPRGHLLLEGRPGCYRIRVGPFRIQYSVSETDKTILVFKIERRDETTYK